MLLARQLPVRDSVAVIGMLPSVRFRSTLYWRLLTLVVVWRRAPPRFKGKPDGDNELAEDDDDESTERFGERRDELDEVGDEDDEDPAEAVETGSPFELCLRASAFRWAARSSLAC